MGLLQPHTPRADPWKQIERLFFSPPDILPGWEQSAPERLICFYSRATRTNQSGRRRGCSCLRGTFKEDTLEATLLLQVGCKKSKSGKEENNRSFAIMEMQLGRIVDIIPDICHGRHGRRPCKFFLAGVNFYRFNAKNWHFRQILREKVAFFTDLTRKIGVFRCKFYSPKILPV